MIVRVLHKCGHECEHNYKSKASNLPAWLYKSSQEDCPNCMYEKLDEDARLKNLPMLTGSIEQRVWAMAIRNEILLGYNLLKKEFAKKGTTKKRKSEILLMLLKIKNLLMSEKESAFWIKHKTIRAVLKFKKIIEIRRKVEKTIVQTDYKMNFEDDTLFDMFEGDYENRMKPNLSYLC